MEDAVKGYLNHMLEQWNRLQMSDLESLENDSLRFGAAFYDLIDEVRQYFEENGEKPESLEEAMDRLGIKEVFSRLPEPLSLHFANELSFILEGVTPMDDAIWA